MRLAFLVSRLLRFQLICKDIAMSENMHPCLYLQLIHAHMHPFTSTYHHAYQHAHKPCTCIWSEVLYSAQVYLIIDHTPLHVHAPHNHPPPPPTIGPSTLLVTTLFPLASQDLQWLLLVPWQGVCDTLQLLPLTPAILQLL